MKKLFFLIVLISIFSCAKKQEIKQEETKQEVKKEEVSPARRDFSIGYEYLKQKRYDEAINNFLKALAESTSYTDACIALGKAFRDKGDIFSAESAFLNFLSKNPDNPKILGCLGNLYTKMKQYDKARNLFIEAIKRDTTIADLWDVFGGLEEELNNLKDAAKYYEKAYNLKPKDMGIVFRLGSVYQKLGEIDKSIKLLENVKEFAPDDIEVRVKLGDNYFESKKYQLALDEYNFVLGKIPNFVSVRIKVGKTYTEMNKFTLAEQELNKALEIETNNISAYYALIDLYNKQKLYGKSINAIENALKISPQDEILYCFLGDAYLYYGVDFLKKMDYESVTKSIDLFDKSIYAYNKALSVSKEANWKNYAENGLKRARKYKQDAIDIRW